MSTTDRGPRPLAGLRVLDLTRVLAGPFCTLLLADLGADVVKVERPPDGDDSRRFGPFLSSGASAYFVSLNRGKRSIALDLGRADDRQMLRRLAGCADVLVENFRPGTLARLGLDQDELRAVNPGLVVASISGFGQFGPDSGRPAYDVIIQALSGLMSITGSEGGPPVRVGSSISDLVSGLYAAIGILAALVQRAQQGRGTSLDLAMLDCSVATLENALSRASANGENPGPLGTRHPSITPFQGFATADGALVIAAGNESLWRRLCEALGRPELADDPRFATNAARTANQPALAAILEAILSDRPTAHWTAVLDRAGVPAAPIRKVAELLDDPHLAARGMLHRMQTGGGESFLTAGTPFVFDGQKPALSQHAPKVGEHGAEVIRQWLA